MKVYEIGTGYTPIPATMGAATEIVVEELTKALRKQNVPVEIIDIKASNRKPNDLPINEVRVPGCFTGTDVKLGLMHKLKRVVYSVCLAQKLKKLLKQSTEKVVLHFHNQYNMFFFLKLTPERLRKKAVLAYTNHSGVWSLPWDEVKKTIQRKYFQEYYCQKKADLVFVLNKATKERLIRNCGIEADKIHIVKNGVNTDIYHPLSISEKQHAKTGWKLEEKKVLLQVGSVCENKGQARVVNMLAPLMKEKSDLVYVYAGGIVSDEYHKYVMDLAESVGLKQRVIYAGTVQPGEELNRLYNIASATIVASGFEAFSLVTVEALAAGIPTFINHTVPLPEDEACIRYGEENLCTLLENNILQNEQYAVLVQAARSYAESNYSWDHIAKEYQSLFVQGDIDR